MVNGNEHEAVKDREPSTPEPVGHEPVPAPPPSVAPLPIAKPDGIFAKLRGLSLRTKVVLASIVSIAVGLGAIFSLITKWPEVIRMLFPRAKMEFVSPPKDDRQIRVNITNSSNDFILVTHFKISADGLSKVLLFGDVSAASGVDQNVPPGANKELRLEIVPIDALSAFDPWDPTGRFFPRYGQRRIILRADAVRPSGKPITMECSFALNDISGLVVKTGTPDIYRNIER
jgi:hypothetical protein